MRSACGIASFTESIAFKNSFFTFAFVSAIFYFTLLCVGEAIEATFGAHRRRHNQRGVCAQKRSNSAPNFA